MTIGDDCVGLAQSTTIFTEVFRLFPRHLISPQTNLCNDRCTLQVLLADSRQDTNKCMFFHVACHSILCQKFDQNAFTPQEDAFLGNLHLWEITVINSDVDLIPTSFMG